MRLSYRPDIPPPPQSYRTQIFDHLGLVAGLFAALGMPKVLDTAAPQDLAMRLVTAGHAVQARVLHGLGVLHQQRSLVPHCFQQWWQADRPRCSTTAPSAPRPTLGRGGAQALEPRPPDASPLAPGPWRRASPTVGHAATRGVAFAVRRTHGPRATERPTRGSPETPGTPGRHVACAACKPRRVWRLPALAPSLSASWPWCGS